MAVVQISRIQARRGLQQDLPTLASAELGWSVDTRKLYIGNGTLGEGAPTEGVTEILTQYTDFAAVLKNYTFKGNAGGYTAQTTTSQLSPIVRTIQDKLDDFVNVKDFGAVGDGIADDTVAINRAITQIYLTTRLSNYPQVRRTIYFPAGTYIVSGATILIPPYARLVGDGIESTIIKQTDSAQSSLFQLTDSMYQTGATLGQNSATLPGYITVEHMTLANTSDKDIAVIDSAEHVTFFGVEFLGSLSSPTTSGSQGYAGVRINSFARTTRNVNFWSCKFKNTRYAALSDDASSDVRMNGCLFVGLYKGLKLGQNSSSIATTPSNYKVLNSIFSSVANTAIDCYANVTGVLSSGNHYIDVGNNFAGAGSPVSNIVSFIANGNTSANDVFDRNDADNVTFARLSFNNAKNVAMQANVGVTVGTYTVGTGGYAILTDNISSFTNSNVTLINGCSVSYSITRGAGKRFGTLLFSNDGTSGSSFSDNFTTTGTTLGVVLGVSNANVITYTTTSTGTNAIFKYNINYFS
jgi:hypothetical protein